MSEPPLSGAFQVRCEADGSRVPERQGGLGILAAVVSVALSLLANKLLPPDWRATRMKATKSLATVPAMHPGLTQPSLYPYRTRPLSSTVISLKSRRLRSSWLPPGCQTPVMLGTGSLGWALTVSQVLAPS